MPANIRLMSQGLRPAAGRRCSTPTNVRWMRGVPAMTVELRIVRDGDGGWLEVPLAQFPDAEIFGAHRRCYIDPDARIAYLCWQLGDGNRWIGLHPEVVPVDGGHHPVLALHPMWDQDGGPR